MGVCVEWVELMNSKRDEVEGWMMRFGRRGGSIYIWSKSREERCPDNLHFPQTDVPPFVLLDPHAPALFPANLFDRLTLPASSSSSDRLLRR